LRKNKITVLYYTQVLSTEKIKHKLIKRLRSVVFKDIHQIKRFNVLKRVLEPIFKKKSRFILEIMNNAK